jgi:integrase
MSKCPYPACLCQPDRSGHVQVRTPETEESYRKRYSGMSYRLSRKLGQDRASLTELIADITARQHQLSRNTLKQYRAVILQRLRVAWDADRISREVVEASERLCRWVPIDHRGDGTAPAKPRKTSAKRARSISEEKLAALTAVLLRRETPIRQIAAGMLSHGTRLGLRPGEWFTVRINDRQMSVRSAKFSTANSRGLAERRPVPLDDYSDADLVALNALVKQIGQELQAAKIPAHLLRRCQAAVRAARQQLRAAKTNLCLYSSRQQFRANAAAAGSSNEEIAVLMGHVSADTNQSHYGRAAKGWKSARYSIKPTIQADLIARVRPGARTASKLRAGQALSYGEREQAKPDDQPPAPKAGG